jgi:hypothetical protein
MPNQNVADITAHEVNANVTDFPKGEAVAVSVLPLCDICVHVRGIKKKRAERALFDGKTNVGSWANMCLDDFKVYGVGLGTGFGQRLVIPGLDKQEVGVNE